MELLYAIGQKDKHTEGARSAAGCVPMAKAYLSLDSAG